jgi:hypothetical protein
MHRTSGLPSCGKVGVVHGPQARLGWKASCVVASPGPSFPRRVGYCRAMSTSAQLKRSFKMVTGGGDTSLKGIKGVRPGASKTCDKTLNSETDFIVVELNQERAKVVTIRTRHRGF